jgi:heptosyltransferase I
VNRYPDAALQFLQKPAVSLPWGKRVEFEGVMALIETGEVIARFEQFCRDQRLA